MYWHPYDIEARHQLAREHAERLQRDLHSARKIVRRPGLTERIALAFLPRLRRRRTAAAAAAAEAAQRP
jgi:hypothetical protein